MDSNQFKEANNKWLICPECQEHVPRIKDIILYHSSQKLYVKYRCRCPLVTEKTIELKLFISKIKAIDSDNKPSCFNLTHPSRQSTHYCPLCASWFCTPCLNEHKLNFPSHVLSKKKFNLTYNCYVHNNREINMRCSTCDTNGCELCIKSEHSKHKAISYADYWEETRSNHQFKSLEQFTQYAEHFITKNEDYKKKWFEKNKSLPDVVVNEINKSFNLNLELNTVLIKFSKMLLSNYYGMKSKQNFTVVNNVINYLKYNMSNNDLNQRGTSRNLINHFKNCFIHHLTVQYKCCWDNYNSHNDKVKGLIKLDNGNVASYSDDRTVKIWDVYLSSWVDTMTGHEDKIVKVIQLKSRLIITVSKDNALKVWELNSQSRSSLIASMTIEDSIIEVLGWANDLGIMTEKKITLFQVVNRELLLFGKAMKNKQAFKSMIALNEERVFLSLSDDNEISKWRVENNNEKGIKCLFSFNCMTMVNLIIELYSEAIAVTAGNDVIILQPDLKKEMKRFKVNEGQITCITQLDDDRIIMGVNGCILLWSEIVNESYVEIYNDTLNKIIHIIEMEDLRLATIWNTHTIKLWNMANLKCITIIEAHKSSINCLIYLSEGKLMTASDDYSIKIWN